MNDAFDLDRFIAAQARVYDEALTELRTGRKRTHWMWFVFPQLKGLGTSPMAQRYALSGLAEASAYLAHPILGPRLRECAGALLGHDGLSARDIMGSPDDVKLRSCCTLFDLVAGEASVFGKLLEKYFDGVHDSRTLELLQGAD